MRSYRRDVLKSAAAGLVGGAATYTITGHRETTDEADVDDRVRQSDGRLAGKGTFYVPPEEGIVGIQQVIDTHAPNVTVLLGEGQYFGSGLALRDSVRLVGVGHNATVLKLPDNRNEDLIVSPNPGQQTSMRVRFQDITFDGNGENNSSGDIVYGAFWNSRFVNCEFVDAPNNAFWLAGSSDSTDDNYFQNCRFERSGAHAIRVGTNRDSGEAVGVTRIDTCWFGFNDGRAVRIRGNGNFVTNSKFYSNRGNDVFIDRGDQNLVIDNDMSKPNPTAPCVSVESSKGVNSSANRVGGNVIFGSFPHAIFCRADGDDMTALQVHENNISGDGEGNQSAIRAVGGEYVACSVRDNTITGEFSGSPIQLPGGWATSDNLT